MVDVQVLRPRPWALALHDTTYSGLVSLLLMLALVIDHCIV